MGIYRSTNPTDFNQIDGIVIAETAPPSAVRGVGTGKVLLIGQFERGPAATLVPVGSAGEIFQNFGASLSYSGMVALQNKKFSSLVLCRAVASDAALAVLAFSSSATVRCTFSALYKGLYGNLITIAIASGTTTGKKYTITDTNPGAVFPQEIYDNVAITGLAAAINGVSKLVSVVIDSSAAEPTDASVAPMASGVDGTIADTDYQACITAAEIDGACDIECLDTSNATRNGYLKTTAANMQDRIVIMAGAVGDAYTDAVTAVATLRDSDGRCIYAFNHVQTVISGVATYTDPASWLAALISQIGPNVDPAFAANTQYLAGVTGLKLPLTRAAYIALKNAGICAFEYDADIGFKVKTGCTTQIADSSKTQILRRRMADYLTKSVGAFLKSYQNAINSLENRNAVKSAILSFVQANENVGLLPKDKEVKSGKAKLVDTDSLNTDTTIGQGFFYVLYQQRIYSSMRFIVLQAQIGETVVVTAN